MNTRFLSKSVITCIVTASMAMAAIVFAQPFPSGPGGGPGIKFEAMMSQQLGLSESQQSEIDSITATYKPQMKTLFESVHAARNTLDAAIESDTYDEAAIRSAAKTLAAAEEAMFVVRGKMTSEIRTILTDEQREKAKELRRGPMSGRHRGGFRGTNE